MSQEFATIAVTPVGNGIYRVFSMYEKENVALTAQALLELSIWIAANRETIEKEAHQEETGDIPVVLLQASEVVE